MSSRLDVFGAKGPSRTEASIEAPDDGTFGLGTTPPASIAWDPGHGRMRGDEGTMMTTGTAHELAAPLASVKAGRLVFTRGASNLRIRVDASMEYLYRARFDGKIPEVAVDAGTVTVRYRPSFHPTRGEMTLSGRVPWDIETRWGMSNVIADLEDLELEGLRVSGGSSHVAVRLPRPRRIVALRIGGGASDVELIRPAGVPVRVRIGGGVSKLSIDEFRLGSGGGKTDWRSPDYDRADARYDIEIGAGASRITVGT